MKNNMMKKLLTLVLAGAMTLSLAACGTKDTQPIEQPDNSTEEAKTYKVAVIKQLDHASLDEIANAVTAELDKIAADNGVTIPERNISTDSDAEQTLIAVGGKRQVPCLFIDGAPLYESSDIIAWVQENLL